MAKFIKFEKYLINEEHISAVEKQNNDSVTIIHLLSGHKIVLQPDEGNPFWHHRNKSETRGVAQKQSSN